MVILRWLVFYILSGKRIIDAPVGFGVGLLKASFELYSNLAESDSEQELLHHPRTVDFI